MNRRVVSFSRIDHILFSSKHRATLRDAQVVYTAPFSDHRPVSASSEMEGQSSDPTLTCLPSSNSSLFRLNPSICADGQFREELHAFYLTALRPSRSTFPSTTAWWEAAKRHLAAFAAWWARSRRDLCNQRRHTAEAALTALEAHFPLGDNEQLEWWGAEEVLREVGGEERNQLSRRSHFPLLADGPALTSSLISRLQARSKSITFSSLKLPDGTETLKIKEALASVDSFFRSVFALTPFPPASVSSTRSSLLLALRSSTPASGACYGRRMSDEAAAALAQPFSADEVKAAITLTPKDSSPGPSGLPYEFYRACPAIVAEDLAATFNETWASSSLPPSQTVAQVRLLFKSQKAGADPKDLRYWRPISLRETDYKIMAKCIVTRLNRVLPTIIPSVQHGFVPGRLASDAGTHLRFFIQLLKDLGLPKAVLLSLDQEKAYDLVSHSWILECYEAFGAPPPFLRLLRALYDGEALRARFILSPHSRGLLKDWQMATNGRLNVLKTEAAAIGDQARDGEEALQIRWSEDNSFTWAGFPFSPGKEPLPFYSLLLSNLQAQASKAAAVYLDPRTRTDFANSHLLSRSLHPLPFSPAPASFLSGLENLLIDFVWGPGRRHLLSKDKVFLPRSAGGLGLLSPVHFDLANSLCLLGTLLLDPPVVWADVARASFSRHVTPLSISASSANLTSFRNPWSIFSPGFKQPEDAGWSRIVQVAKASPPFLYPHSWTTSDLLSLPPLLFSRSPRLRRIPAIAALYWHSRVSHGRDSGYASFVAGSTLAREAWEEVRQGDDFLSSVLPPAIGHYDLPTLLPAPSSPTTFAFSFLSLPHAFSAGEARQQLALARRPLPLSSALASLFDTAPDDGALEDMWRWIGRKAATAREVDVHWRLAHGGTTTAKALHRFGKRDSPDCAFCGEEDSVTHSFFTCHYSAEYWEETVALLAASISPDITSTSFSPAELVLSLPTLSSAVDKSVVPTLRAIVAIALSTIDETRRSRIRPDPALTSPSPTSLASRFLIRLENRLMSLN
ncbi:hypothetical protein JCM11641_008258 [Rhodosporidiobolus odoratus]